MPPFPASRVRSSLAAAMPDVPVTIEHTGGGCLTLYVGSFDASGHAWLAIGPGNYAAGTFDPADTWAGPDDDGTDYIAVRSVAECVAYVMAHCTCRGCPSVNTYHAGLCEWCIEACTADAHTPYTDSTEA